MRVLVLGPHPYYIDRGTPIDVDILLRALSERGERVDALVYADGEDRHYENVRLHRIPSIRFLHGARPGPSLEKLLSDVLFFFTALRLVLRNDYDVILAGGAGGDAGCSGGVHAARHFPARAAGGGRGSVAP